MDAQEAFAALAAQLEDAPGVERGTGFGTMPGLRVRGKIFAMVFEGRLVLKLPAERVAELSAGEGAAPFEMGTRRLREWVALAPDAGYDWLALGREALAFVGAAAPD